MQPGSTNQLATAIRPHEGFNRLEEEETVIDFDSQKYEQSRSSSRL